MDSANSKICITDTTSSPSKSSSKRLLFDRRYGWVLDDWTDPSKEALAGGRGMFCVLPIGKKLFETASKTINLATSSAIKVYERAELNDPQLLQANLCTQLHKFTSFIINPFPLNQKVDAPSSFVKCSYKPHVESGDRDRHISLNRQN